MISAPLARSLRAAGLRWTPDDGDRFVIDSTDEAGEHPLEGSVFTISEMTIEEHRYETGSVLGFNGTTEWALDSVALEDALWLPAEHQLRDALAATFRSLSRHGDGSFEVTVELPDGEHRFTDDDPAEAYGAALLALVTATVA
jgi:hypothetical protein